MRTNEMPGCCRVGILNQFPQGEDLEKDALADLAKSAKREMSYHPVNLAILVKDGRDEDYESAEQKQSIQLLKDLGFVELGSFENGGTGNGLVLLGHGLGQVELPELPKLGIFRGRLSNSEINDICDEEFPSCCGASMLEGFPMDEEGEEDAEEELPLNNGGLTLAVLRSDQRRAMGTAIDEDAVALGTFASEERGKTLTLFAWGLEESHPVKAPRKKTIGRRLKAA